MAYTYPVGGNGGSGGGVAGVGTFSGEHLVLNEQHGNLAYFDGTNHRNMLKVANDGDGVVIGSGHGDVNFILGDGNKLIVGYASGARTIQDSGTPTVNSDPLTTYTWANNPMVGTKQLHETGIWCVEGNVGFRIRFCRPADGVVMAQTCDDQEWGGGASLGGAGGMAYTSANAWAMAPLEVEWPIKDGTMVDVVYEFKSAVTLVGEGIWPGSWTPSWRDDQTPLVVGSAVFYDVWMAKTYAVNDKIVEDGVIYRANTAGAQVGSFAAESAKWTEVGNIPAVMTYKGGISVADFNLLATGAAGDFYRISGTGTLTGGQAAVVGDQVVVNQTVSVTITAAQFDYFANQEPGIIIPPWTAKSYALDEVVYEGEKIWYCNNAGVQATSFATHAADWQQAPRISSNIKVTDDDSYNLGAASKGLGKIFTKRGLYYDSTNERVGLTATGTTLKSPDATDYWQSTNGALTAILTGTNRISIDGTKSEMASPDGSDYFKVINSGLYAALGAQTRLQMGTTKSQMLSPNGSKHMEITNTQTTITGPTKLGANAPALEFVEVTGLMPAAGADNATAHGLVDHNKAHIISALVQTDNAAWMPISDKAVISGHSADFLFDATNVKIWLAAGNNSINGNAWKIIFGVTP